MENEDKNVGFDPANESRGADSFESFNAGTVISEDVGCHVENKKRRNAAPVIIVISAVAVAVAVLITGILTSWFGLADMNRGSGKLGKGVPVNGPLKDLIKATFNSVNSDSWTLEAYIVDDDDTEKAEMRFQYDPEKEEFVILLETEVSTVLLDGNKQYTYSDSGRAYYNRVDDEEATELFSEIRSGEEIDWGEITDLFGETSDTIRKSNLEDAVELFFKECLMNEEWLEETLGFERRRNEFVFEFKYSELAEAIIEIADDADLLKGKKVDALNSLDKMVSNGSDVEISLSIKIADGYISTIYVELETKNQGIEYEWAISDYNKTEISDEEKDDIKDTVDDLMEEYRCSVCGMYVYGMNGIFLKVDGVYRCSECMYGN